MVEHHGIHRPGFHEQDRDRREWTTVYRVRSSTQEWISVYS
ncbi:hypothetical protein [Pseudarthrobacter sulfonivorans]|nr:hypothetical protein [Pseudarthrobacter sulfonivorans]